MNELSLSNDYYVESDYNGSFQHGKIFHIAHNKHGGSVSTGVAYFHVWKPAIHPEGYFPHHRLDCFISHGELAPDPAWLARRLFDTLIKHGRISEPVWLGWHRSEEIDGEERGSVFDWD
ncbi:MAG: hypothetical protein E5X53_00415 [Mesorhizobium sp.]|uniref:hypothetical protein n=1 Tax=Mesorhizobium sp. TaxID=1871066 RepID=UPI000FE6ABC3|nr:hypothetical protein [Mesorhizobium sp.]RWM23903.1 MAG: hypothetical protein EOR73_01095 [Mesorhizobium sp.]TIP69506.1 MAG: hypothetical protein E5X55_31905 [Mesorhizobium sp.]TIQ14882.1 MAG: hypothetical protein E5X57_02765 [Mesorhizobium sp.]TIR54335.1 MAG: hypothetical protein E5X53_00415 [Mesorhizobium sp.]TJV99907.1 MAG: hypothetical protein E5X52_04485 [Mesorhizobium sp.]